MPDYSTRVIQETTDYYKRMKRKFYIITTISDSFSFFSGQPRLWKNEFDVCAISSNLTGLRKFAEDEGIRYKQIPMRREISLISDIVCFFRILWIFIKDRPYLVHGNTPKASLLSMLAAWITRIPVRIYMCHGLRYQSTSGMLYKLLVFMEKLSCSCATTVICVSDGVRDRLVKDGLCNANKAQVVGFGTAGGVDLNFFSHDFVYEGENLRKKMNIDNKDFVFIFIGRIVKDKGINELVSAFIRLQDSFPNIHLILVGRVEKKLNPISEKTEMIIKSNNHIHAVGPQSDVRPFLSISNALVLPSYREGVGMVLIEANAMGIPCIASDILGCRDVVKNGVNGSLVKSQDVDALYDVMEKWVENPEEVNELSSNCRESVVQRFSHEDVINAYYRLYKTLAS